MGAPQPVEVEVEDQLERRIRKPVDLLRCVLSCTGITLAMAVQLLVRRLTFWLPIPFGWGALRHLEREQAL